jgi:hypothetical protein
MDATSQTKDRNWCWRGQYEAGNPEKEPQCANQAKFERLYLRYRVDVVFSGHVHAYERTGPIAYNRAMDQRPNVSFETETEDEKEHESFGVVYITAGAGGRGVAKRRLNATDVSMWPAWSKFGLSGVPGALHIVATPRSLRMDW